MRISVQVRGEDVRFLGRDLTPGYTLVVRPDDGTPVDLTGGEWIPEKDLTRKQRELQEAGEEIEKAYHPFVVRKEEGGGGLRAFITDGQKIHTLEILLGGMSFRATKPTYDRAGNPLPTPYVTASGVLTEGLYHFDLSLDRCRVYFVGKEDLVRSAQKRAEKAKAKRKVKERVRALKSFTDEVEAGKWRGSSPRYKVRIEDEHLRFPDHSGITLPAEGEEACQVFAPGYGPEDCLATLWGGWNPAEELTVDNCPPALRENVKRALSLLTSVPHGQVHLLPKSGEQSPILRLGESGNGLRVYRTVGLEKLGL